MTCEGPQILTRRPETPGTLCGKCGTQEVFDCFDFKGKIEGSQTHVVERFSVSHIQDFF